MGRPLFAVGVAPSKRDAEKLAALAILRLMSNSHTALAAPAAPTPPSPLSYSESSPARPFPPVGNPCAGAGSDTGELPSDVAVKALLAQLGADSSDGAVHEGIAALRAALSLVTPAQSPSQHSTTRSQAGSQATPCSPSTQTIMPTQQRPLVGGQHGSTSPPCQPSDARGVHSMTSAPMQASRRQAEETPVELTLGMLSEQERSCLDLAKNRLLEAQAARRSDVAGVSFDTKTVGAPPSPPLPSPLLPPPPPR